MFDNYAVTVMIGGEPYTLGLFDTAGRVPHLSANVWYGCFTIHFHAYVALSANWAGVIFLKTWHVVQVIILYNTVIY